MRHVTALALVLAAFSAVGFAARADTSAPPTLVAKVVACDLVSSDRSVTFGARMDTIPGAAKLQIRFQLLERLGRDTGWARLDVPALRVWHTSVGGVGRYGWKQTVDGLHPGGAYKAHVLYRWLSSTGTVLDTETRDTPVCRTGLLPNLVVGDLSLSPGPSADTRGYTVNVSNTGKVDVDQVEVQMRVDRADLGMMTISHLAAGESQVVTFTGPLCHHAIRVTADPNNQIGETVKGDNSQLFSCPS
jgi:hypothetical protein